MRIFAIGLINLKIPKNKVFVLAFFMMIASWFFLNNVSAQPPGVPATNELYKMGYLDVTLFGADPTGVSLSTDAIQKAVNLARDYDLVCFFPSGTYLVDDTIKCLRKCSFINNRWRNDDHESMLVGSGKSRPVIKLKAGASLFQNVNNPMPVFWFWSMAAWGGQPDCEGTAAAPITDPECEQSNVNYHHLFKGIDIDLNGNPGAVGIRMAGAQGATIEDVKIYATGAYAGICNPPGQGGGTYNVEVEGGQYGFYLKKVNGGDQSRFQILSGCTFRNQTKKAFSVDSSFPIVLVGFHIISDFGPINLGFPSYGLSLIDGVIEIRAGRLLDGITNNLYMKNVFVKGASIIANTFTVSKPSAWTRIDEYSYCSNYSINLINGNLNKNTYQEKTENLDINSSELAEQLINKHVWNENTFLHFESPEIVNVKDATKMNGKPAKCDGISDDTEALRYAIANYDNIFLPKGKYIVSKTLKLGKNTKIIGAGRTYSVINHSTNWNPADGNSIMETVDDAEATTTLAFLGINTVNGHPPIDYYSPQHPLLWRAGRNSMVRSVNPGLNITVTGNGGGRWSAIYNHKHQFFVDGTTEPLSIYGFNPERAANPQCQIKNSKNVNLYYVKSETHIENNPFPLSDYAIAVKIINSSDINIHTSAGNFELKDQMGMFEIENSTNISINHVRPFKNAATWYNVKETNGSSISTIPSATPFALYKSKLTTVSADLKNSPICELELYPNPCKDFLCINRSFMNQVVNYKIVDINGIMVDRGKLLPNEHSIPVKFQSGIYFISIEGNNVNLHSKFIKD
jgi:hypothetical protein